MNRIVPSPGYVLPSDVTIKEGAKELGLRIYSPDFVRDLAAYINGGQLVSMTTLAGEVNRSIQLTPDSDGDYKKPGRGGYTRDRQRAYGLWRKSRMQHEVNIREFLGKLELGKMGGTTPLDKALKTLLSLQESKSLKDRGDGTVLPVFLRHSPQESADRVNELFEDLQILERDQVMQELLGDLPQGTRHWSLIKIAEIAKIARLLDERVLFALAPSATLIPDQGGREVRRRRLKKFSELSRANGRLWALPRALRNAKIATKEIAVREKCVRDGRKQLLGVLVDCSGSMDNGSRIENALGVLVNRLKAAAEGRAEVWFSFFSGQLRGQPRVAHDMASAKKLLEEVASNNFAGQNTNIEDCTLAFARLLSEQDGRKPEIAVVTDGQDYVSTVRLVSGFTELHMKLHAFIVGQTNEELVQAARELGGLALSEIGA